MAVDHTDGMDSHEELSITTKGRSAAATELC